MRARLAAVVSAWLVSACTSAARPALSLRSVTPSQSSASARVPILIDGEGIGPSIWTDFRREQQSALRCDFSARLIAGAAAVALEEVTFRPEGTLSAVVPAGVARGEYDLEVTDPSGQTALLPQAFRVVTSAEDIAAVRIDVAGEPRIQVPFIVSLTAVDAQGRTVDGFDGTVALSDATGTLAPKSAGPFLLGRAHVWVTVEAVAAEDRIAARDTLGHEGTSEPFAVRAGLAVKVAFAGAPVVVAAGACSPAVELELRDSSGLAAPAASPVEVVLSAGVADGVSFFSDAGCRAPASGLTLPEGEVRGRFYFSTARAGSPTLRAAPALLPSAAQVQTVTALAPTALVFASPAQALKAGACSAPAVLRALDELGNPSPVPASVAIALTSAPAAGLSFHADGACGGVATSLTLAAGASQVEFTFRAASEGNYHLEAAAEPASGLAAAAQDETVESAGGVSP